MKRLVVSLLVALLVSLATAELARGQSHDYGSNCVSGSTSSDIVLVANTLTTVRSLTVTFNPHNIGFEPLFCFGSITVNNTTAGAGTSNITAAGGVAPVVFTSKNSIPATSFADEQFFIVDSFVPSQSPLTETVQITDTTADTVKSGSGMMCCGLPQ